MNRKIRLSEREMNRIVRRVINEGVMSPCSAQDFPSAMNVKVEVSGSSLVVYKSDGQKCYCNFDASV